MKNDAFDVMFDWWPCCLNCISTTFPLSNDQSKQFPVVDLTMEVAMRPCHLEEDGQFFKNTVLYSIFVMRSEKTPHRTDKYSSCCNWQTKLIQV